MDYREALLLRAARETGILDAVTTDAGTPEAVAAETEVTERAACITLQAMAEMGYLRQVDGEYEPTNEALGFIAKADVRSIGSVSHELDCVERWIQLPETMRTGELPDKPDDWTVNYVGAMANADETTVRSSVTAAIHRHPDAERVLDAGGGPGLFAKEFVRRGFDVTLVDHPEVVEIDRRFLEHEPIELVEGDVTEDLPGGFDLVFCSRVVPPRSRLRGADASLSYRTVNALGPDGTRRFLDNAYDALDPGGVLVLIDLVRGRAEGATVFGAHVLAQTENGDAYTETQFTEWLEDAGFEAVEIRDVPGTNSQIIAGRRPHN